ncbi:MFS transporter [Prauserella marina]|uniref:Drug resistance transporter, EmrB/QacA subfamily n=1 Tax=Prauserella marina TaxID=530584 RepID=A0A222W124_9PSEU|nr:MFS transporter [Prauserella marina]ASR39742.1 MFS transporter [Prauserella marina]PWV78540.1 EmrB/QacA subfamily drug resistance transporter [Prauserella marina]SDC88297.1 drug resistance transporter, EmrB/QacA subfamily [Prauserella marina]
MADPVTPVDNAGIRWGSATARGVLATTILGSGMAMLDGSVVNVALPRIGDELGASVAGLQWILDGYLLSLASLILIAGALGDRYGRLRVFQIGVVWFAIASLLCGLAPTTELLVAARVLQGIGGALLTPGSLAILQATFAKEDRARAIGAWSGLGGLAAAIGPLLGGVLVQVWSWRLAFFINLPLAVVCIVLARRYVPESCDQLRRHDRPSVLSSALCAIGLAGVTAALVEAKPRGFDDPLVVVSGVAGVLGLVAFVVLQLRSRRPLIPPSIFADRTFALANGLTLVVYAALGGVLMLMVLQLQGSLGYSPMLAGAASLPITFLMLVLSGRSGALAQRIGPRTQLIVGPLLLAAGVLLLRRVVPGASYVGTVLPAVVVFGLGLATVVAPVTATVLAAAPDHLAGVASGVNNAIARTGNLLAVALLPAIAGLSGAAYSDPVALTAGWRDAMWVCAGLLVVGAVLAFGIRGNVLSDAQPRQEHVKF